MPAPTRGISRGSSSMPIGQGLFGGATPYPISPSAQPGLMQDAWRQFGLQLLANAQNQNVGQGLAAALASGRQAYAGGAEQAYQVGREQKQDKQYQQYREAQIQASEALAEQREQDADTARKQAEQAATQNAEIITAIQGAGHLDPLQKQVAIAKVRRGEAIPADWFAPQDEGEDASDWVYDSVRGQIVNKVTGEAKTPAGIGPRQFKPDRPAKEEEGGISESTRRQLAMAEWKAAAEAQKAAFEAFKETPTYTELSGTTTMAAPPAPDLAPFLAKYGLDTGGGGESRATPTDEVGPDQQVAQVLASLPPELASRPGLAEQVAKDLAGGATPEELIERMQALLAGRQ